MNFKLTPVAVAYDGTRFVGWQRQAEGESIQGVLEDALARFSKVHRSPSPARGAPTPACTRSARWPVFASSERTLRPRSCGR